MVARMERTASGADAAISAASACAAVADLGGVDQPVAQADPRRLVPVIRRPV